MKQVNVLQWISKEIFILKGCHLVKNVIFSFNSVHLIWIQLQSIEIIRWSSYLIKGLNFHKLVQ